MSAVLDDARGQVVQVAETATEMHGVLTNLSDVLETAAGVANEHGWEGVANRTMAAKEKTDEAIQVAGKLHELAEEAAALVSDAISS